jgi:hypothetical protein
MGIDGRIMSVLYDERRVAYIQRRRSEKGTPNKSSLGEDFLQELEDFRHVKLDVLEVQQVFIVFLLRKGDHI